MDLPGRLFTLIGWRSLPEQDAARQRLPSLLDPPLQELGATVEHFLGRTRVEIDRPPPV